jgi:hypothetical protein
MMLFIKPFNSLHSFRLVGKVDIVIDKLRVDGTRVLVHSAEKQYVFLHFPDLITEFDCEGFCTYYSRPIVCKSIANLRDRCVLEGLWNSVVLSWPPLLWFQCSIFR